MIELRGMKVRDQSFPDGDIEIKITGLKPGEKLYEELLVDGSAQPSKNKNIFFGKDTSIKFDELQQLLTETEKLINIESKLAKGGRNTIWIEVSVVILEKLTVSITKELISNSIESTDSLK